MKLLLTQQQFNLKTFIQTLGEAEIYECAHLLSLSGSTLLNTIQKMLNATASFKGGLSPTHQGLYSGSNRSPFTLGEKTMMRWGAREHMEKETCYVSLSIWICKIPCNPQALPSASREAKTQRRKVVP